MALMVLQNYHSVGPDGVPVPFGVTGGSSPYVWSVALGGAGGSIDGSGNYLSPDSSTGIDTILVSDSSSPTAMTGSATIAVNYPTSLVADIIRTAMGLANEQVYLWDQKIDIPKDSRLYVIVGVQTLRPFGNRPRYSGGGSPGAALVAEQSVNVNATLTIDILSRGPSARDQKEQVLLALSSPYAQAQMELNGFFVAPLSTAFVNLSHLDASAIPYRFQILVNLQYFSRLTTQPSYFNNFPDVAVTTEP